MSIWPIFMKNTVKYLLKLFCVLTMCMADHSLAIDWHHLSATLETRHDLYHLVKWPAQCEQDYADNLNTMSQEVMKRGGLTVYPLNQTQALIQVLCFTAAYQANYYYVFVDAKTQRAQLIYFKTFDDDNHHLTSRMDSNVAGLPAFKNGTLILLSKARGVGDCGSLVTYGFTNQGTSYVIKARVKNCDDQPQDPENWPVVKNAI